MVPYIIAFTTSLAIFIVIQKWNRKGIGFAFWSFVALLIPCVLAGLRDPSIGTDVQVYLQQLFDLANRDISFSDYQMSSWWNGWKYCYPSDYELGFSFLVWSVTAITHSFPVLMFAIQAVTIIPVYLGLLRLNQEAPLWLGMAVYYFMYFNSTLNVMRQWIAMGILIFALGYLFKDKKIKYIFCVVAAMAFHTTALFGFAILALYVYLINCKGSIKRPLIVAIIAAGSLLFVPTFSSLIPLIGLGDYTVYLGRIYLLPNQLLLRAPALVLLIYYWRKGGNPGLACFFFGMLCFEMAFSQLASAEPQSARIAYYFAIISIYYVPIIASAAKSQSTKLFIVSCVSMYCLIFWIYTYVISGASETVPYVINSVI